MSDADKWPNAKYGALGWDYPPDPHTPPEGAVEAGARGYYEWATMNEGEQSKWDTLPNKEFPRARAEVILTAAHEAGEICWREEHERMEAAAHQMLGERNDALDAKDEAVALLREIVAESNPPLGRDIADPHTKTGPGGVLGHLRRCNDAARAFLATQEDRA